MSFPNINIWDLKKIFGMEITSGYYTLSCLLNQRLQNMWVFMTQKLWLQVSITILAMIQWKPKVLFGPTVKALSMMATFHGSCVCFLGFFITSSAFFLWAVTSTPITLPADHPPTSFLTCFYSALGWEIRKSHLLEDEKNNTIFWTRQIILKFIWKSKHAKRAWKILKKRHYKGRLVLLKCCIKLQ